MMDASRDSYKVDEQLSAISEYLFLVLIGSLFQTLQYVFPLFGLSTM
jgi:hypothetical protein